MGKMSSTEDWANRFGARKVYKDQDTDTADNNQGSTESTTEQDDE